MTKITISPLRQRMLDDMALRKLSEQTQRAYIRAVERFTPSSADHPLEVADIFTDQGPAYRRAQQGHLSLGQLKVMSAIESCRTETLGGHRLRCASCDEDRIAYNSCRNRHCPKCQSSAAQRWLKDRQADLLDVEYYHVVFTLPVPIAGGIRYSISRASLVE